MSSSRKGSSSAARPSGSGAKGLVDDALKTRWNEAIVRYRKARAAETTSWDARYEALGEILDSDPPYYLAAVTRPSCRS